MLSSNKNKRKTKQRKAQIWSEVEDVPGGTTWENRIHMKWFQSDA